MEKTRLERNGYGWSAAGRLLAIHHRGSLNVICKQSCRKSNVKRLDVAGAHLIKGQLPACKIGSPSQCCLAMGESNFIVNAMLYACTLGELRLLFI